MIRRVLIIGGYGNFGRYIAYQLAEDDNIQLIIAGRSKDKAESFAGELIAENHLEFAELDIHNDLIRHLASINPDIVIHTSGPFQNQNYDVAKACIAVGCHYIDLADGRGFVEGITELSGEAAEKNLLLVSGASSVPCLTAALVDHYLPEFASLDRLDYGITTAQKTNRGLATTSAILGYVGKPFQTLEGGIPTTIYGWQDLHLRRYRDMGNRMLGNCDIPDLALFPKRYPDLKTIRFYAGLEVKLIHLGLWALSGLVRIGFMKRLQNLAPVLLKISFLFDWAGTANSGFHMELSGTGVDNKDKKIHFELTAKQGDGPYIPCTPAILLTRRLSKDDLPVVGAFPCIGLISKDEYLGALKNLDITWHEG